MFHFVKAGLHCIGKMLKGSGMDDALVEAEIFGLKTLESVKHGTHYIRSLQGMHIVANALESLKWKALLKTVNHITFEDIFKQVKELQKSLNAQDSEKCQSQFCDILKSMGSIEKNIKNSQRNALSNQKCVNTGKHSCPSQELSKTLLLQTGMETGNYMSKVSRSSSQSSGLLTA